MAAMGRGGACEVDAPHAPPPRAQAAQPRDGPHAQDGPQPQDGPQAQVAGAVSVALASSFGSAAQSQVGAQVQGLQVQDIGELHRFGLRWAWCTLRSGRAIERRG